MSYYMFLVSEFCGSLCWCFESLMSCASLSEGFLNIMFKPNTDFIQILFIEHIF